MNLTNFAQTCELRKPVAIVLCDADYYQLQRALDALNAPFGWDRERMQYRGHPILMSEHGRQSYIVEDTPEGPLIHFVG